jgi:hypothetical protein
MSYWFHRNPLKATARQAFDIKMFAHDPEALKICGDLKMARARLLELLPDPNHTIEQVFSFCNDGKNTFITEKIVVCSVPDPNRIWIRQIRMFLGLLDPDPLVRGMDPDPSIIM